MERNNTFLFQPTIHQFTDITNIRNTHNNINSIKSSLRTSYVEENNYDTNKRKSTSKDKNCIKGITKYDKTERTVQSNYLGTYEPIKTQRSTSRQYSALNKSSNQLLQPSPFYQPLHEASSFIPLKTASSSHNRSMKVSIVGITPQIQQIEQSIKLQNRLGIQNRNLESQRSKSKQKFNFRQSLGTLSKHIKNTLKLTNSQDISLNNTNLCQKKQVFNNSFDVSRNNQHGQNSKNSSTCGEGEESYVRYQKSSSFLLNAEIGRLKRPKHLQFKIDNNLQKILNTTNKQNYKQYGDRSFVQNKYSKNKYDIESNPLGRSTVTTSTISQRQNTLKFSSIIQPLTPQLRTGKKYDSYNYQKQKLNTSVYQTSSSSSLKPDITASYSKLKTTSNFGSPKSSFLQYSSVVQTSKFSKQRDSIVQKERRSFDKEISLNDFHLGSIKGQGRFGKFYPAIHKNSGMLVGIKQIKKQSLKNMLDQFIQQIKIQSFIEHPNIVRLYGYFSSKQNIYLILEYMEEGSLFSFVKKSKKLQQQEASTKLKQICSAVQYLHENQILHRDIKPENIVMTCDVCKLCDFGWAVYSNTRRKTYCGTLDYVCPQILQGDSYDSCVDIWAIGVLAFEMIVGKAPFYNISRKQTMKKIMECNFELPKQLSSKAKQFISKALNKNPNERQSVNVLAKHEFLN